MNSIKIIANGAYFPKRKVNNKELANKYNITEEYIYKRTGIENRFFANDGTRYWPVYTRLRPVRPLLLQPSRKKVDAT